MSRNVKQQISIELTVREMKTIFNGFLAPFDSQVVTLKGGGGIVYTALGFVVEQKLVKSKTRILRMNPLLLLLH